MSAPPVQYEGLSPFVHLLGITTEIQADGSVLGLLKAAEVLQNRKGDLHGGAIASLIDTTMGHVGRVGLPAGSSSSTLNLTINFISAGRGDLRCIAQCSRKGQSIAFVEARVEDETGKLVALGMATFKIFSPH